jgi:hypothetical protein
MTLKYDAYQETIELEKQKDSRLQKLEERVSDFDEMFHDWERIQIMGTPDKPK